MRNLVPSRWGLCLPAQPPRAPPGYRAQTREEPSWAPKGLPGHRRDQGPAQPNFTRVKSPSSPCLGHPPPLSQTPHSDFCHCHFLCQEAQALAEGGGRGSPPGPLPASWASGLRALGVLSWGSHLCSPYSCPDPVSPPDCVAQRDGEGGRQRGRTGRRGVHLGAT